MRTFLAARPPTGAVFLVPAVLKIHRIINIITGIVVRPKDLFLDLTKAQNKLLEVHHSSLAVGQVTGE